MVERGLEGWALVEDMKISLSRPRQGPQGHWSCSRDVRNRE
jgi:hypothetical protein